MKTRTALKIDHYVGTILCWALSLAVRAAGILLRRDHRPPYAPTRILFIKLMGAGSVVQALPAMAGVRDRFPNARIRMICFPETAGLAKRLDFIEAAYTVNNTAVAMLATSTVKVLIALLVWRPQLVIDLEYHSKFSSLLSALTMAQNRAGLFDVSTRFRDYLYTHLVYANPRQHIADLYMQVARIFGVTSFPSLEESMRHLCISPDEEASLNVFLQAHDIAPDTPLLVLNPNAGDLCLERRWPAGRFGQVAAALASNGKVILVGSPGERDYVESVLESVPHDARGLVVNAAGALGYGAYLALLKKASLLITNDSGPMHLAAAFGTPTVSLWGPGAPQHYEPRTGKHVAVWARLFCSPCLYVAETPPCRGDNACMEAIGVHDVLNAVKKLCPHMMPEMPPEPISAAPHNPLLGVLARDFTPSPKTPDSGACRTSRWLNEYTVFRLVLCAAIVLVLLKWAAPALHLLPMRAKITSAQGSAAYDPGDPHQDFSAARLIDNRTAEGLPSDGWVLPEGQLGSAVLTWSDPLRVTSIEILNAHSLARTQKCAVALDNHSLGVFPVQTYPRWTELTFGAESSPPVNSVTVQITSSWILRAGLNEVRVYGYPVNGRGIMLAKAAVLIALLAAQFFFPRTVHVPLKTGPGLAAAAVCAHLLIMAYIVVQQVNCIRAADASISPIADGFSESNAVRAAEGFADLGFFKYAGLPDVCYGDTWSKHGFQNYIKRVGEKTDEGYLIPPSKFPVSPDHYVYTHYPPGPEYVAGVVTTLFGKNHFFLLRAVPVAFGLFALVVFAMFLRRHVGPLASVAAMVILAATPMVTNMMHGLHYQGYAQSLLLLQIAVLGSLFTASQTPRPSRWILLFLIAFVQGYMSFDYCFLVAFAAVPIYCFTAPGLDKTKLARLAMAVIVAGAGFTMAHAVHFAQVAAYYGSFAKALEDLGSAGQLRLQPAPLRSLARDYGWQLLYDARFFHPYSLWVAIAAAGMFVILITASLFRASAPDDERLGLGWRLFGILSALLISSAWIALMRQHASMHPHFLPRHFFLLYLCLVLFIVTGRVTRHVCPQNEHGEVNEP